MQNFVTIQSLLQSGAVIKVILRLLIAKIICQMLYAHPLLRRQENYSQLIAVALVARSHAEQLQTILMQQESGTQ
jgi:hypothetical protein